MKHFVILFFALFTLSTVAQKSSFKDFYKETKGQSEFSINLPAFIANAFISDDDVEGYETFFKKAKNYKLLVFEKNASVVSDKFKKFAKNNHLKTLIKVKENGDNAEIYFIEEKDIIKEIIIKASDKQDGLVFIGLKTSLTKDELAKLVENTKDEASN